MNYRIINTSSNQFDRMVEDFAGIDSQTPVNPRAGRAVSQPAPTATFKPNPVFPVVAPVIIAPPVIPVTPVTVPPIGGGGGGGAPTPESGAEQKKAESHNIHYAIGALAGAVAGYFGTANYKKGIYADKKWIGAIAGAGILFGGLYGYYNYIKK